jgi:hypothetical protein
MRSQPSLEVFKLLEPVQYCQAKQRYSLYMGTLETYSLICECPCLSHNLKLRNNSTE